MNPTEAEQLVREPEKKIEDFHLQLNQFNSKYQITNKMYAQEFIFACENFITFLYPVEI